MLNGKQAIIDYLKPWGWRTIKRLYKEEDFPLQYVNNIPIITKSFIEEWLRKRLIHQKKPPKL